MQHLGTEVQMLLLAGYAQGPLFSTASQLDALEATKIAAAVAERSTWAAGRLTRRQAEIS